MNTLKESGAVRIKQVHNSRCSLLDSKFLFFWDWKEILRHCIEILFDSRLRLQHSFYSLIHE